MNTTERRVRVRMAPSPTGDLHVGGARTALFTWLYARHHDGDFILRIEDTDRKRFVEQSLSGILEAFRWLGLDWDEGPEVGGPKGPYIQSERLELYQHYAHELVERGHAYYCFCTPERLSALRDEQRARHEPPGYDRHCRNLSAQEIAELRARNVPTAIRFKMPDSGTTAVDDLLRGQIAFENRLLEDPIILKSDGYPTYHLAVVVDDHLMEITTVTRGEEWIPSAPIHVQLYQAFGWEPPAFAHLPVILRPDGKGKLSKRDGDVGVLQYKHAGYLPEALVNYLALLGWSSGDQEIFTRQELIEKFALRDVSPSPARFNFEKLAWMNQYYINHVLTLDDLTARCVPYLQQAGLAGPAASEPGSPEHAYVRSVVALVKDRLKLLPEVVELTDFFFTAEPEPYDPDLLIPRKTDPELVVRALEAALGLLEQADFDDETALDVRLRALAGELDLKAGQLFMPIRVAVTGRTVSPGLFETLRVLGKERSLARLRQALIKLQRRLKDNAAD
ncbi:MAG TPA: glutamate--tRNA ligase [Nitrolancea sp.]|nr:glutamate--tRNA ligase [Nitrolancea sp.]